MLKQEGQALAGEPVRLKVRHRAQQDGSRPVDAVGFFDATTRVTTRYTGVTLSPGNYEIRLQEAEQKLRELVKQARQGLDTRIVRGLSRSSIPAQGELARQMRDARNHLMSRSENLQRCRPRQLQQQLRWLAICEEWLMAQSRSMSVVGCLRALSEHYGGVESSSYKKASTIVRLVCRRLELPNDIPDELMPRHRYEPAVRAIPDDAQVCERLKGIEDPGEARLIYAVVVYGRRVAEIFYADWAKRKEDGDLPVFASKTGKRATSWPVPFGDEQIDLSRFRPPRWHELGCVDQKPDPQKARLIELESSRISRLIKTRLGCTATDLRHRWGSVCLVDPRYKEDAMEIAAAMLTSIGMLEKTYLREMREYRNKRKLNA